MTERRILLVEDDADVARTVLLYLESGGYAAVWAEDGRRALELVLAEPFDLVVLDLMLPGLDGWTVCRRLREVSPVPVVMLTARAAEDDRVRGLDLGADDYVPKPFSPRELMARIRAVLRRTGEDGAIREMLRFDGLTVDVEGRVVTRGDDDVALTAVQFDLLLALARRPGRVFRRDELIERTLGPDAEVLERTVDAHVKNLRRRLEVDPSRPRFVETVTGVGYRFAGRPLEV